jgi:transposase-like protein
MICPDCLSWNLIKFGKYNNHQKWHCEDCGLTTIYPRKRMPIKRLRKIIKLHNKTIVDNPLVSLSNVEIQP